MKKIITFTATALLATSAFAGTFTATDNHSFDTAAYASKAEAYNAGFDLADELSEMTQSQLRNKLVFAGQSYVRGIEINNAKVTVQEFSKDRGDIAYRAVVNVAYSYTAHESGNH